MKSVLLLGLGASHAGWPQFKRHRGEVWTMNDWYGFRGPYEACKRPQRVYNIHEQMLEHEPEIQGRSRFKGWREAYERSGALIVTCTDLGLSRERRFDKAAALQLFPDKFLWCSSWSYMMMDAVMEGYNLIRMERISLFNHWEFMRQAPGTLALVDLARSMGVKVIWPFEKATMRMLDERAAAPDYKGTFDVNIMYGAKSSAVASIERTALQLGGK